MVTDSIKEKKTNKLKIEELEKKYAKLKEEYSKVIKKIESRDL